MAPASPIAPMAPTCRTNNAKVVLIYAQPALIITLALNVMPLQRSYIQIAVIRPVLMELMKCQVQVE